ncbi:MAG: FapA family protein, partial [[Eubacterium] saphenum]|nr:FapA family protein [[Eubacterium] saphenum]
MAENVNNNSENAQNNGNSENKEVTAVVDCRIDLTVDSGGKSVNLTVHPPINGGKEATVQMVKEELKKQNIVFGVDEKIVKKVVEERLYGVPTCIAEYKPPKKGANGYISFRFDKEHKLKPVQDEFGIADYRELNSIVPIRKNEVVADIVQPEEGTPGKNVFGQEIPGEAGVPAKISLGRNTLVT